MNEQVVIFNCGSLKWISLAVGLIASFAYQPVSAAKPHIVYINADDLGLMDVGYNDPIFRTPNIDRLAKQGMVFTAAYAPAANCAPSRASVHSGQWTPRHGVYTVGTSERGKAKTRRLIPTENTQLLSPDVLTMAEALKAGGYRTIHLGKYHIGKDPLQDGFDVNVGGDQSGSPSGGYYSPWSKGAMAKWTREVDDHTHRVDVFANEAVEFMEENRGEPMFIHFSPYLVHSPLTPVPEYVDNYQRSGIDAKYGSMVEKIDESIGKVLAAIDRLDLTDSTLVVFSSDNGGIAAVHSQKPLRGGKGSYYEGGVREPFVMRWPGKIAAGTTCAEAVNTMDLYPTFLAAAEVDSPARTVLDGVSLMPLMTGSGPWEPVPQYWHFPVYLQSYDGPRDDARDPLFRTRPGSAMRSGKWKLHEYFEDGALELYDLSNDPGERQNLATSMPEQTAQLHAQMVQWRERTGAPVPTQKNPAYDAEFESQAIQKAETRQ
ncbi:sulfatase [Allorhodopirellula heiligendammensis]|uniref:Arylsulfatase n=1 Tax=Allorhodopirellula heiligendammensis TaxID=2714739 RepID=A0A5C6C5B8_9BACT|nr:sulfatase [Allorhodopirellula heiligendammensis]TWU19295.1 Arylsulfatase [Allorhodopirellula heiligendammensis]